MNRMQEDGFNGNRLFFTELGRQGMKYDSYGMFRDNVFWIESNGEKYVIKGFRSKETCLKQLDLSDWFEGFKKPAIGLYLDFPNGKRYMKWNRQYWLLMPFHQGRALHFGNPEDVASGIMAARRFHKQAKVPQKIYDLIPPYTLYPKWERRLQTFKDHVQSFSWPDEVKPMLPDLIRWGEWCLQNFRHDSVARLMEEAREERQLCHGDVAPHNFVLQDENMNNVFLIDYDLINAAPAEFDWLQYANRILPFWQWSFKNIKQISPKVFMQLFKKRWFLICLVFPTDVYREWNRAIQSGPQQVEAMVRFMQRDFKHRKKFIEKIIKNVGESKKFSHF